MKIGFIERVICLLLFSKFIIEKLSFLSIVLLNVCRIVF